VAQAFGAWFSLLVRVVVMVFPAVAAVAYRSGGRRRLARVTGWIVAALCVSVAIAASPAAGNALAATEGYFKTSWAVFGLVAYTCILPVVVTALVVDAVARRGKSGVVVFVSGMFATIFVWLGGTMIFLWWSYHR
jgi:hypothetical protein